MQEPQAPPSVQNAGSPPTEQIRPAGLFSDLKYPDSLPPRPPAPAPLAKPNKVLSRVVLPLVILCVGVAGIAWVTQFLPGRVTPVDLNQPGAKIKLEFNTTHYIWPSRPGEKPASAPLKRAKPGPKKGNAEEPDASAYIAEYEIITHGQQDGGFCDYEFKNATNLPIELALLSTYCQCSSVEMTFLTPSELAAYHAKKAKIPVPHSTRYGKGIDDFAWTVMKNVKGDGQPVLVEPGQEGLVRLHWDGRGQEKGKFLKLYADMQMNPKGHSQQLVVQRLRVDVFYVEPVRVVPPTLPPIAFVQGSGASADFTLHCWSTTRDLTVEPDTTDPCLTVTIIPLEEPECRQLEKTLSKDFAATTRIRSACRLEVKLVEKKDNHQLSLGVFEKPLPVRFKDKHTGEVLANVLAPELKGMVRGDLKVNGSSENLKIDLGSFGARVPPKVAKLWMKASIDLQPNPLLEPRVAGISAAVQKAKAGAPGEWEVTLTVADNVVSGPLPPNLVLVLRLKDSTQTIRIPVTGHRSYN